MTIVVKFKEEHTSKSRLSSLNNATIVLDLLREDKSISSRQFNFD